jgi:hypothetical protein
MEMGEKMHQFKLSVLVIATALCAATTAIASPDDTLLNGAPMPGPTNTGLTNPNILTPYTGPSVVTTAGTVIENASITGGLEIDAPNVTIENCLFDLPGTAQGQPNYNDSALQIDDGADDATVENSSFTGGGPGTVQIFSSGHNLQCLNLNIYNTPTDAFQLAGSTTISGCWLHQIGWNAAGITSNPAEPTFTGTDHVNDIFFDTGAFLTVTNNNFDTRGNPTAIDGVNYSLSSFCIFTIPYDSGMDVGPVTVNNNYLDGGSYMFSLCGQGPTSITNNIIGSDESYGLLDEEYVGGPLAWEGNDDSTESSIDASDDYPPMTAGELTDVPEPASLSVLTLGGVGILLRRRRT